MILTNHILTDFNEWRQMNYTNIKYSKAFVLRKINIDYIRKLIDEMNKSNQILIGMLNPKDTFIISLLDAAYTITNIKMENDIVYGDLKFLDNEKGKLAYEILTNINPKLEISCSGTFDMNEVNIKEIITWNIR